MMRIAVIGGTRFIGRALVRELAVHGHEVLIVHRGEHEPPDLPDVEHLHANWRQLADRRTKLDRFRPDALADLSAMTGPDAGRLLDAVDPRLRLLVVSSMDVYRAFESLLAGQVTQPIPLREDSPVRRGPPPDAGATPGGWDFDFARYEKLDVERAYLARGATVCRLPFVYGEHDYQRREDSILGRIRADRRQIPMGSGTWLASRGYAPELARAMRLALELARAMRLALESDPARGEVFNLCESTVAPMRLWAEQIVAATGANAELVQVPYDHLPPDLWLTSSLAQHLLADATKARDLLDWTHAPAEECLRKSVAWHVAHPPPANDDDFTSDDAALRSGA
jgi:nucleoside-diphosphate-sugar epimerase